MQCSNAHQYRKCFEVSGGNLAIHEMYVVQYIYARARERGCAKRARGYAMHAHIVARPRRRTGTGK